MESNDAIQHEITPLQDISPNQMKAIVMRAEGYSYSDVGEEIDVPVETVKNWFRKGTETNAIYREYAQAVALDIGTESLQRLKILAREATDTICEILNDKSLPASTRLRAATYLHDKVIPLTLQAQSERDSAVFELMCLEGEISRHDAIKSPTEFALFMKAYSKHKSAL